ncbi:hypothetical protein [Gemmatimonas sp.]|uniref:hypothetical protein n=1 Tax=Gemmatimonas sp. TaxID=1962908 RepID=UPI003DA5A55D
MRRSLLLVLLALSGCSAGTASSPVAPVPPAVPSVVPPVVWTTTAISAPRVQYRTFSSVIARHRELSRVHAAAVR